VNSAQMDIEVSLDFEGGKADVTGVHFVLLLEVLFLHVGQGAAVVGKAGVAQHAAGLAVFL
jgi:hypothetical protein